MSPKLCKLRLVLQCLSVWGSNTVGEVIGLSSWAAAADRQQDIAGNQLQNQVQVQAKAIGSSSQQSPASSMTSARCACGQIIALSCLSLLKFCVSAKTSAAIDSHIVCRASLLRQTDSKKLLEAASSPSRCACSVETIVIKPLHNCSCLLLTPSCIRPLLHAMNACRGKLCAVVVLLRPHKSTPNRLSSTIPATSCLLIARQAGKAWQAIAFACQMVEHVLTCKHTVLLNMCCLRQCQQ